MKNCRNLRPASEEVQGDAAVVLLLRITGRELKVLVVKRVENPADRWSGQMALPGGKRERADGNLKQTAIRETLEETSIDLCGGCRFLGVLDDVKTTARPEMRIVPFVVLLEKEPIVRLEKKELEDFMWVSTRELPKHRRTVKFSSGESTAYVFENSVIWGLTYGILTNFIQIVGDSV